MTNEEAKAVLQEQIDRYGQEYDAEGIEALEIAINVLEQQPCEDCISRQELLKELGEEPFNWNDSPEAIQEVRDYQWFRSLVENAQPVTPKAEPCEDAISRQEAIKEFQIYREYSSNRSNADWVDRIEAVLKDLPSVTPWSGWIPVSEKLPEPLTAVLLTVRYKSTGQWTYQLGYWEDALEKWEKWLEIGTLDDEFDILAWMELPEKYEEGEDE